MRRCDHCCVRAGWQAKEKNYCYAESLQLSARACVRRQDKMRPADQPMQLRPLRCAACLQCAHDLLLLWSAAPRCHASCWASVAMPAARCHRMWQCKYQIPGLSAVHLHGHTFQVIAINGKSLRGALRDTALVPPKKSLTVAFDVQITSKKWFRACPGGFRLNAQ